MEMFGILSILVEIQYTGASYWELRLYLNFWGAAINRTIYSKVNQPTKMASATEKA